jgi:hypothetical protein|uniref:Secreted protein n=1 Tax=Zea mays TaxID=4577 RepID=A0A804N197_MAIZE
MCQLVVCARAWTAIWKLLLVSTEATTCLLDLLIRREVTAGEGCVVCAEKTEVPPSLVLRLQGASAAARRHIRLGLFEGENEHKAFSREEDLLHITDTWMMLMMPYVACFFDFHYMLVHAVALCRGPLQARRAGRGALAKGTLTSLLGWTTKYCRSVPATTAIDEAAVH